MGWFGNLLKKLDKKTSGLSYADLMNGRTPVFTQFGTNIYASDVVQQAITCITLEMKKLRPMHILQKGSDPVPMYGKIQKMLK